MPFTWRINIKTNPTPGGPALFEFEESPQQIVLGDLIIWSNQDTVPHFPGAADNKTLFMSNQIAPNSSSSNFRTTKDGTITYICSLHPNEIGTIVVGTTPAAPVRTE